MLSNPMLDVAIGLILLYLLLSIIVTVLQEFLSSTLKLRNANLVKAVGELVGNSKDEKSSFFNHPLIYPLFRGGLDEVTGIPRLPPAYIPRRNFALAVLDLQSRREATRAAEKKRNSAAMRTAAELEQVPALAPSTQGGLHEAPAASNAIMEPQAMSAEPHREAAGPNVSVSNGPTLAPAFALAAFFEDAESGVGLSSRISKFGATAENVIAKIENKRIKSAATSALSAAVGELKTATDVVDTAVKELENLYDSTMDRASGWYKVNAQRITFFIGVAVALLMNVDTIHVAKQLSANDELRARAVEAASAYYASEAGQAQLTNICQVENGQEAVLPVAEGSSTLSPEITLEEWQKVKDCVVGQINDANTQLAEIGYPIGWTGWAGGAPWDGGRPTGQPGQNPGWAVVGILFTGLALSLGASFWFDLLGKFMNVRMTGKREVTATGAATTSPPSS